MIDYGLGVHLNTLDPQDLCTLRAWRNDYRIWKWCRQNDLITIDNHMKWASSLSSETIKMYGIFDSKQKMETVNLHGDQAGHHSLVGACGLTSIDYVNRRAEFSLYVFPTHQKKGYGEQGLRTLLTHGFLNIGLNSIWGETYEGNPALGMFEKIGFVREGTRRKFYFREGEFIDAHLVSILSSEFISRDHHRAKHQKEDQEISSEKIDVYSIKWKKGNSISI